MTEGALPVKTVELRSAGASQVTAANRGVKHTVRRAGDRTIVTLGEEVRLMPGEKLVVTS